MKISEYKTAYILDHYPGESVRRIAEDLVIEESTVRHVLAFHGIDVPQPLGEKLEAAPPKRQKCKERRVPTDVWLMELAASFGFCDKDEKQRIYYALCAAWNWGTRIK